MSTNDPIITLSSFEGDDYALPLSFINKDTGLAIDITGYTFYLMIKESLADSDTAPTNIAVTQTVLTDPTNGKTTIPIARSLTAGKAGVKYVGLKYKTATNFVKTIFVGKIEFIENADKTSI